MRRFALLALMLGTGCSLVLDPDDHVGGSGGARCDRDGDGAEGPQCGGPDCDDDDGGRYPGALPNCDGTTPPNCWSDELDPSVRALFGADSTPEFGYLPRHTDATTVPALRPGLDPDPSPKIAALATTEQAVVAYLTGDVSAGRAARVSLFAYDPLDPANGAVLDPGLASPQGFTLGAHTADALVVAARTDGFFMPVQYRTLSPGAAGALPLLAAQTLNVGGASSAISQPSVALLGGYVSADTVTHPASLAWMESDGTPVPKVRRAPVGTSTLLETRVYELPPSASSTTQLVQSGGALSFVSDVATGGVWNHAADSGDFMMPSGTVAERAEFQRGSGPAPKLAVVPGTNGQTYVAAFRTDDPGDADAVLLFSWNPSGGVATSPLRIAGVDLEDFALAPLGTNSVVLAVRGRDLATNEAGVLLYMVAAGQALTLYPLARPDELGRPFLVRPDEANGRDWVRLAVTTHVEALRATVMVTGVSDDSSRVNQTVSVGGVRACMY